MVTFAQAVDKQEARTWNGMKALKSSASSCVDLFFKIGASRGKNISSQFVAAYNENRDYTLRIAQWARDVRQGSGERQLYRDIILDLIKSNRRDDARLLIKKIPELGRWDDVLVVYETDDRTLQLEIVEMIRHALAQNNGLCAKWMPRKGLISVKLRDDLGWTPKFYRKRLVELTKVVETYMCQNRWNDIDFNAVPSVASARYKKAFHKHSTAYQVWAERLASGDSTVKVNAGAVYPYDVIKGVSSFHYNNEMSRSNLAHIEAQWNALPNYVGDGSILPLVDVSGSMTCKAGGYNSKSSLTCLDVAVSLGLYLADKNKGAFKDIFLTFSSKPELLRLKGNILDKVKQMITSNWSGSTNLHFAIDKILSVAVENNVPSHEMPKILLILSDMQFNQCVSYDDSAFKMIQRKYENAGYQIPNIVFWNINAANNVPVSVNKFGTALVSGFSPAIVKSVLSSDLDSFTPEGIMLKTIMIPRYEV